jgi:hypothetical protein
MPAIGRIVLFACLLVGACGDNVPTEKVDARLANLEKGVLAIEALAPLEKDTLLLTGVALTFDPLVGRDRTWNTDLVVIPQFASRTTKVTAPHKDIPYFDLWWRWPYAVRRQGLSADTNGNEKMRELAMMEWVVVIKPRAVVLPKRFLDSDTLFSKGTFEGEAHVVSLVDGTSRGGFRFTAESHDSPVRVRDDEPFEEFIVSSFWADVQNAAKAKLAAP